ncbi:M20 family metallopeptidase [Pendulispora albinea]|uniref:Amidohydrolase n=1 Tax=Pendulispora albinea TaxID=2741071 RepID=A0ABZ2M835_9BACT
MKKTLWPVRPACLALLAGALSCSSNDSESPKASPPLDTIRTKAESLREELIGIRRDIHMHPELSGEESRTAKLVADRLRALGLDVRTDVGGHGVVGLLRGARPGPVIAYRADMDAMPDPEPPGRPHGSTVPGKFHICGHDLHVTVGLGVASVLASMRADMQGTVVFLFQPAEETLKGAEAMLRDGALAGPRPDAIYALHTFPAPVGQMAYGAAFGGNDNFRIQLTGPNATRELAEQLRKDLGALATVAPPATLEQIDTMLADLQKENGPYARALSMRPRVVADRTPIEVRGTVKVSSDDMFSAARESVAAIALRDLGAGNYVLAFPEAPFPAMVSDPAVSAAAAPSLSAVLGATNTLALRGVAVFPSEDFELFLKRVPGAMFLLGVGNRARGITGFPHMPDFDADEGAIEVGTKAMSHVIWQRLAQR